MDGLRNVIGDTGMGVAAFVLIMAAVFWAFAPFAIFGLRKHLAHIGREMTALVDEVAALREAVEGRRISSASVSPTPERPLPEPRSYTAPPAAERREPILNAAGPRTPPPRTSTSLRANRDE